MRGWNHAALAAVCLGLFAAACGEGEPGSSGGLPVGPGGGTGEPALSVYGMGDVGRSVPQPCRGAGPREFDFWVGKWNVFNPAGTQIATSVITSEMDGCLVMEDFINNSGFQGKSISAYDRSTGAWHQTFVDNVIAGSFRLSGGLRGEEMVMAGSQDVFNFPTQSVLRRDATVFWTPLSEGRVRQRFETSFDGGPVTTTFNGTYVPAQQLDRATPTAFQFCRTLLQEFRQLDFWLGEWTVTSETGGQERALGRSQVRTDLNDCLLQEDFETLKGYRSRSYLYFDFVAERWFRTFTDNTGTLLELSGNLTGEAMVMTGMETGPGGHAEEVRVTIEPHGAGGVRQTWERLKQDGESGREELVLVYSR